MADAAKAVSVLSTKTYNYVLRHSGADATSIVYVPSYSVRPFIVSIIFYSHLFIGILAGIRVR